MTTAYDVPGTELIEEIVKELKQNKNITEPDYIDFVKTGAHKERAPQREDWFYVRMASVFRRIYLDGPVGTESLRTYYGGRKNRKVRPHRHVKAGGKIIRNCLQVLEKEGLIKKEKKGRILTSKGIILLNKSSKSVLNYLKEHPKTEKKKDLTLAKEKSQQSEPKRKEQKKGKGKDEPGRDKGKKNK